MVRSVVRNIITNVRSFFIYLNVTINDFFFILITGFSSTCWGSDVASWVTQLAYTFYFGLLLVHNISFQMCFEKGYVWKNEGFSCYVFCNIFWLILGSFFATFPLSLCRLGDREPGTMPWEFVRYSNRSNFSLCSIFVLITEWSLRCVPSFVFYLHL